jgi:hypothetical protein
MRTRGEAKIEASDDLSVFTCSALLKFGSVGAFVITGFEIASAVGLS